MPASTAAATAAPKRTQPARERASRPRIHLVTQTRRRAGSRGRLFAWLGIGVVTIALLIVAASQAMVASQQVRLDTLNNQLTSAVATNENLQLSRAQLAAPARILKIAEKKLAMISPNNVVYLSPVDPGPSIAQAVAK